MKKEHETVYNFIKEYKELHGTSPSIREIAKGTGKKSTGSTWAMLNRMEKMGLIYIQRGKWRSIEIVGAPYCYYCGKEYE